MVFRCSLNVYLMTPNLFMDLLHPDSSTVLITRHSYTHNRETDKRQTHMYKFVLYIYIITYVYMIYVHISYFTLGISYFSIYW